MDSLFVKRIFTIPPPPPYPYESGVGVNVVQDAVASFRTTKYSTIRGLMILWLSERTTLGTLEDRLSRNTNILRNTLES